PRSAFSLSVAGPGGVSMEFYLGSTDSSEGEGVWCVGMDILPTVSNAARRLRVQGGAVVSGEPRSLDGWAVHRCLEPREWSLFLIVCWALWFACNRKVHGRAWVDSLATIEWRAPPGATVKVNFDGQVFGDKEEVGVMVVVRDQEGVMLAWVSGTEAQVLGL
ncbi:hypothetical protein Salat_0666000, partial [Sesamum alatum]